MKTVLISQIKGSNGEIVVAVREPGGTAKAVNNAGSVYALAMEAANGGKSLASVIEAYGLGDTVDLEKAYAEGRFLPPMTHPDAAHLHLTGQFPLGGQRRALGQLPRKDHPLYLLDEQVLQAGGRDFFKFHCVFLLALVIPDTTPLFYHANG